MATATAIDSRGNTLKIGDLVYSFGWGDNYIVSAITPPKGLNSTRIQLVDAGGVSVGWCDPTSVAFVAPSGGYSNDSLQRPMG